MQEVVPASDVLASLRPGEAFALITLGANSGYVFLLRDGTITAAPLGASPGQIATLDTASNRGLAYPYWHQAGFAERNPFPVPQQYGLE